MFHARAWGALARLLAAVCGMIVLACASWAGQPAAPAPSPEPPKPVHGPRVLIISTYERFTSSARLQEDGIRRELERAFPGALIRSDYLISGQVLSEDPPTEFKESLAERLRLTYSPERGTFQLPDVVVTVDTLAFDVVTGSASHVFKDIPVVFSGVTWSATAARARAPSAVGVVEEIDPAGTLQMMMALNPRLREVMVINRDSAFSPRVREQIRAAAEPFADRLTIREATADSLEGLHEELAALPPNSAVLFAAFVTNGVGHMVIQTDWPVPMYGMFASQFPTRLVGGSVVDATAMGAAAGRKAARILAGELPASVGVSRNPRIRIADYRALRRWEFSESALPPGTTIIRRPEPWVLRNRSLLAWAVPVALLQACVIAALMWNLARRRRLQEQLERERVRLALVIRGSSDGFWDIDFRTGRAFWSDRMKEMVGIGGQIVEDGMGEWRRRLHPDDAAHAEAKLNDHLQRQTPFVVEYRLRGADGMYRWYLARGEAVRDDSGTPIRMSGSLADIDERVRVGRWRDAQRRALEAIAGGEELPRVLREIAESLRDEQRGVCASVLLLDPSGTRVNSVVAPCVDDRASEALRSASPSATLGGGRRLFVEDIAGDPRWASLREALTASGIRACWCEPIRGRDDQNRGVLIVSCAQARLPTPAEFELIAPAADLVGIALDTHRAREALQRERRAFLQGPVIAWRWRVAPGWPVDYVSENISLFGYTAEEFTSGRLRFIDILHPDDLDRVAAEVSGYDAAGAASFTQDYRIRTRDGRWVHVADYTVVERDGSGKAVYFGGYTIDDTERRAAAEKVRESTERYRQIVETAEEGVWVVDATWTTTLVNRRMAAMLGYSREEMLGRPIFDFMDERAKAEAAGLAARREQGVAEQHDFRFRHRNGMDVWTMISTNDLRDADGRFVGALAMVTDITGRKAAEEALAASELRYRTVVEATGAGVFDWDLRTNACFASQFMLENIGIAGVPPDRVVDAWRERLHPEDREYVEKALRDHFEVTTPYDVEYRLRMATGEYRWIRARGRSTRDAEGRAVRMVGSLLDIDARKRADLALRESEQRLSLLVEHTPLAVIQWDTDFRITRWNKAAEAIFGWPAREALGRDGRFIIPERDRRYVDRIWADLLARRGGDRASNRNVTKDGREIVCEWYNSPLVDGDGKVIGVASVGQDVTRERDAKRHQQLLMAELDHRVKNNLTAVISLAEQTGRSSSTYPEFIRAFLGRVRAMARMHSVLASQSWQGADLMTLVVHTLEAFGSDASKRSTVAGPVVTLHPRVAQGLAMALHELATNAVKYGALSTGAGGVDVRWTLHGEPASMTLEWAEHGGPTVRVPASRGFGTDLIEGALAHELGGSASIEFRPGGVYARLELPLDRGYAQALPLIDDGPLPPLADGSEPGPN